jgi:glycine cleavage system T protein
VPRFVLDGRPLEALDGDSIASAVLRAGAEPAHGGTLCLAGDCPNCVAEVDGVAWVRTCQTPARPGAVVRRQPAGAAPAWGPHASAPALGVDHVEADVVVIGGGADGRAAAGEARAQGRDVLVIDAADGEEAVAIFDGPLVVVRTSSVVRQIHAHEVVVATGAAELHPTCPGNRLAGLLTVGAARTLQDRKIPVPGPVVGVGTVPEGLADVVVPGWPVRFKGTGRVQAVVVRAADGTESTHEAGTVVLGLGRAPRDTLARMAPTAAVRAAGAAASRVELPPPPTDGVICPCSRVEVADLDGAWARGFHHLELMKRATLCGTGTCQGAVCQPHLRSFVAARAGETPAPFTARPAVRQLTVGEAAAGTFPDPFRRTALHDEHLRLGATMDRFGGWWRPWHYGDPVAEYWAVREAVSLGDVSTLGKLVVSGPDVVEALERVYPTTIGDLRPGRSRYVLLLDERGHVIDDGMVCRDADTRFVLTFTSSGAANAEAWLRDWFESWGLRVHVLDRTTSLAAINVTGPLASVLLQRCGLDDPPRFLQHRRASVAGVDCHVMRLSFTGEASFELHTAAPDAPELWRTLLDEGRALGVKPHGLQALFGLRLEKGHVIVGQDTELDTTPARIGMDWAVKLDKGDFLGRDALVRLARGPDRRRLVGFTMDGPAPLEGTPILRDGAVQGHVTSSFTSPLLGTAVLLGWLKYGWSDVTEVTIDGRPASVRPAPFYDPEGRRARA